ncbi:MAG: DEAD/DEAH box helicase [Candidatus Gastranaerophilales bacterium]|nr:DEAD/DEAH box helicase [Candidatus Gastranaerophilales bacterium]
MTEQIENIISNIKNNTLALEEYFSVARLVNQLLYDYSAEKKESGRKIIIYILNNWNNVPMEYRELFTDLIAKCGFYPYLEKEKNKIISNNLPEEIKKEFHKSEYIKSENEIYFHSAQKELSNILLNTEQNIVVSAPTSFGKSLLIEEIVASNKYKNIVVIQPTLALLNETRNNLRKYEDLYKVIVRVADKPSEEKGNLFLLTAERVVEYQDLPKIDFFVLDEFYKLSQKRLDERYEVLNNACNKLLNYHNSRFYFLGPNIDNVSTEFLNRYNAIFKKYDFSLVINEEYEIKNGDNYYNDRGVDIKERKLFDELLKLNDQTIIYCSSPEKSTGTAINFAKYLESSKVQDYNSEDDIPLISWIKENFSYKWDLILCLKNKIGLHNGAFPKHINSAIIDYFNSGKLLYLFCTSTIIEGVNTSTKNVIIYNNWRGLQHNKIDYFDYKNIKGRSGRMFKHYVGELYSFYPKIEKSDMNIDIPFVDQEKPLSKEILAQTPTSQIKDKSSKEFTELLALPIEELELFKKNGLNIDGQKAILEHLKNNFNLDYNSFAWTYKPSYPQALYVLDLCFKYLMKPSETGGGISPQKLAKLIKECNYVNNLFAIVRNEVKYLHEENGVDYNTALVKGFQIQRHWFDYKLPKWFGCFNELQKFICTQNGVRAGDYSYFLAQIENDYMSSRANLLIEFDLPKTAIRKIDQYIPENVGGDSLIPYIRLNYQNIFRDTSMSPYEIERIKKEIL